MEFIGGIFIGFLLFEMFSNKISMDSYNKLNEQYNYLKKDINNISKNLEKFIIKLPQDDSKKLENIIFEMNRLSK